MYAYLSIYIYINLYVHINVHLFIHLSIHLSTYVSIHLLGFIDLYHNVQCVHVHKVLRTLPCTSVHKHPGGPETVLVKTCFKMSMGLR